jgi:hypothetical protein
MIHKPSEKEEEYFKRQEIERLKKMQEEKERQMKEEEKKRLKELHYMKCPKCGMDLQEIEYKGIKIDKCFSCEGIFLDKGELEEVVKKEGEGLLKKLSKIFS